MKIDRRQLAAYAVIVGFMAVTVGHVAAYAGGFEVGGWRILGWLYALAVDSSIVVCAWMTRWKTTARWAWIGYAVCIIAAGSLNLAQVRPWTRDIGAWVYATFPTMAQALLGFLARDAGKFTKRGDSGDNDAERSAESATTGVTVAKRRANPATKRVTVADWREYVASLDGNAASVTLDDALAAMVTRGLDAGDKSQRDKVARWFREFKERGD